MHITNQRKKEASDSECSTTFTNNYGVWREQGW